jgi:hypothetical protein
MKRNLLSILAIPAFLLGISGKAKAQEYSPPRATQEEIALADARCRGENRQAYIVNPISDGKISEENYPQKSSGEGTLGPELAFTAYVLSFLFRKKPSYYRRK